ncbi:hypothetical protein ONV78_08570 [Hahella sp. CR1]|uniref:hypothetical protein n=1 Tax=Hahella sp. CR1 TaxID=2992807 RepID=UPI0024424899|nr:hypothetical protein [Hahella sp. CR1]MDG9667782.1 hypothetical protein [Hahella sp. CR1]
MNTELQVKAKKLIEVDDIDSALQLLRAEGASIIESIKLVKETKSISLNDAKKLVALHPVWDDQQENFRDFHDSIIDVLNDKDA